ncbi:MAG: 1-deoxy-D-xylulose-5-phosphate reductoisomerase [Pseudomonadota bacterium]
MVLNQQPSQHTSSRPKRVIILGSTGSIGRNCVEIIVQHHKQFKCVALSAGSNATLLAKQAQQLQPEIVTIADQSQKPILENALKNTNIKINAGFDAYLHAIEHDPDLAVSAIVGIAGLIPTWVALKKSIPVAIANKESLVVAGQTLNMLAQKNNVNLIPIDSEHSALFQLLEKKHIQDLTRLTITASGGPLRNATRQQMQSISSEQALKHPVWDMGPKNSIDSATMMNKGLEVIEASHLFNIDTRKIDVLIHPQSIVHALVAYQDGSQLAQLCMPDMRIAISYALNWGRGRLKNNAPSLDLAQISKLEFYYPDTERFPALKLAYQAFQQGQHACCVLNSANEVAVEAFLKKRITFLQITDAIKRMLDEFSDVKNYSTDCWQPIFQLDQDVRNRLKKYLDIA